LENNKQLKSATFENNDHSKIFKVIVAFCHSATAASHPLRSKAQSWTSPGSHQPSSHADQLGILQIDLNFRIFFRISMVEGKTSSKVRAKITGPVPVLCLIFD
jgi:hypothetical protein